jgi:ribosomal protein L40E
MDGVNWTTTILGCVVWVPIAVWVISLIHWMVMAEIDIPSGVIGVILGFGLGYTALRPPIPILSPIAFSLVVGTVVFFPFLSGALDRHRLRGLDFEAVEKAYEAIGQRPENPFAKFKLAEGVYRLGMIGHAVAIADSVMAYIPERSATEEFRVLKRWKSMGVPPETMRPIACVECGTLCQPGWTHCRRCGAPFLLDRVKGRLLPRGHARRLMAVWASIVAALLGIPAATALPPVFALMVMALLIAGCIAFLIVAFRHADGSAE